MIEIFLNIQKKTNCKKGFTLIELIVVIAIIGILAAVLIPKFSGFSDKAKRTQALVYGKSLATAINSHIAEGQTIVAVNTTNKTTMANNTIFKLSGLNSSTITRLVLTTTGGFTLTTTVKNTSNVAYVASRTGTGNITVAP